MRQRRARAAIGLLSTVVLLASPWARAADVHSLCKPEHEPPSGSSVELVCDLLDLRDPSAPRSLKSMLQSLDWTPDSWREADFLLLGEVHDNAGHHKLRAANLGPHPINPIRTRALVFEHIRTDQQPALDQFVVFNRTAARLAHAGDLFRFLEWDKSGWPDKKLFEPLFTTAIRAKLPILPGDAPRETVRNVARQGVAALTPEEITRLKLDQPLPSKLQDALLDELEASHCGLMPKAAFTHMAVAQRYRDSHLAEALVAAADKHGGAILLAGNGHMRTDRGVPVHLRKLAPAKTVLSVMLIEVEKGKIDPMAYVPRDPQGKPAADYIVLTPRAERADPCAEMRARFGKK